MNYRGVNVFKNRAVLSLTAAMCLFLSMPKITLAVLPPDLVVSVGSQIAGFFSLAVAVIVSLFASLSVLYIGWYEKSKKYSVPIAFLILLVALVVSNAYYWFQLSQIETTDIPEYPSFTMATSSQDCQSCAFYSDSVTLFVPDEAKPLVVELDMSRRQETDGTFVHYSFLNGLLNNQSLDRYTQFTVNDYALQANDFIRSIERTEPADGSVRDVYSGTIETLNGEQLIFITDALSGDFVTRNTPEYTQFQSVAQANITYAEESATAYVLVENLQSNNYRPKIFFPGMDTLQSLTHQFVLWDEMGSFYMIDDSKVFSDTPAYPAHSWLLYKNEADGTTKKGFTTEIEQTASDQWRVTVPDFSNGVLELAVLREYKTEANGRTRYVVTGTIADDNGVRSVSGLLRVVR